MKNTVSKWEKEGKFYVTIYEGSVAIYSLSFLTERRRNNWLRRNAGTVTVG